MKGVVDLGEGKVAPCEWIWKKAWKAGQTGRNGSAGTPRRSRSCRDRHVLILHAEGVPSGGCWRKLGLQNKGESNRVNHEVV